MAHVICVTTGKIRVPTDLADQQTEDFIMSGNKPPIIEGGVGHDVLGPDIG